MFRPHHGQCKECRPGSTTLIVVKAGLCHLHNEIKKGRGPEYEKKKREAKQQQNKIRQVSLKKKEATARKMAMYAKFDSRMQEAGTVYCSCCGTTQMLSHSHLVPVSFDDSLEDNIENITYHCMKSAFTKGCHDIWETHNIDKMRIMNDFKINIERVRKLSPEFFRLVTKGETV